MKKALFFMIFAAQLGSVSLFAQERGEMLEKMFSRMDKNSDGFVEESEAPAELWSRLSRADKNSDGKIDKLEAAEGMRGMGDRGRQLLEKSAGKGEAGKGEASRSDAGRGEVGKNDAAKDGEGRRPGRPDAAQGGDLVKMLLERFSKNGDGKVALADLPAPLRERLAKFDKNDDKLLDRTELKDAPLPDMNGEVNRMLERVKQVMQSLDKDGDGKVALVDFPVEFKERLARFDKNNDGQIEKSELAELRGMVGGEGGNAAGGPAAMLERAQQLFKQYDQDGDGKIALADLPTQISDRVSRLDTNKDGQIDKAEMRAMAGDMKGPEGRSDRNEDLSPQMPKRPDGN